MEFHQTQMIFSQLRSKSKSYVNGSDGSSGCIPEECRKMLLENNLTSTLTNNTVCEENTDPKISDALCSISAVILLILFVELIFIRFKRSFLDNLFGKSVFMMGIVSSVVTQLSTMPYSQEHSNRIALWYNIAIGVFSIIFVIFGFYFLFERSPEDNIGSRDRGMGLVVLIITLFLLGLEAILIYEVIKAENRTAVFISYLVVYACQQIVQILVYSRIRRCKLREDLKKGAIYYFKFLSFLNFTMWLNCITFTDIPIYDEVTHTDALQYIDNTFKALVIDYRLLYTLLFLEHARLAIHSNEHQQPNRQQERQEHEMSSKKRWIYTALGVSIGLACLVLQIVDGAQYWDKSIDKAVNICPILVDVALVFWGLWLSQSVGKGSLLLRKKTVDLVLFMVMSMGAVSVVYLFIFAALSLISFQHHDHSYVLFSALTFLVRGFSLWILLLVYAGIRVDTMELRANHIKENYVLVSALCVGLFSRFIGSILDEFDGTMHEIAHHHLESNKLRILQDLFMIGPLFQLATSLHLSLHFLLMIWRLHEKPLKAVAKQGGDDVQPAACDARQPNNDLTQSNDDTRQPNDDLVQPNVGFAQPNGFEQQIGDDLSLETPRENQFQADERTPLLGKNTVSFHLEKIN